MAPLEGNSIATPTGELLWNGKLTSYGKQVYTEGDCWALAWHVSALLRAQGGNGWLYLLGSLATWKHVVVRTGPHLFFDAEGFSTRGELEERWNAPLQIVPGYGRTTLEDFQAYLSTSYCFTAGPLEAQRVAEALVREYFILA